MHVTPMHYAFLTSRSVTNHSTLGHRILTIAQRHHQRMTRDDEEKELNRRKDARTQEVLRQLEEEKRLAAIRVPMHPKASESSDDVLTPPDEAHATIAQEMLAVTAQAFDLVAV